MGGDLGWVTKGQLDPELDTALADMDKGDLVGPIKTLSGYHLILLIDRKTPAPTGDQAVTMDLTQLILPLGPNSTPAEDQAQIAASYLIDGLKVEPYEQN